MPSASFELERLVAPDARKLLCHCWKPAGTIRGIVLLLHGIESHPAWFEGSCRWLAALGFLAVAPTRRGSGEDGQDRGDIDGYRRWLRDVRFLAEHYAAAHPGKPLHLLGVSWGGKLACAAVAGAGVQADSLVLISPGLAPRVDVPWPKKIAVLLCALFCPTRRFGLPIASEAMFTANEEAQRFIRDDALRLKQVTARFLVENVKLDAYVKRQERALDTPVLLLLAEHDEIIDTQKTRSRVERFVSPRKKILRYPGMTHTLEFEPNPDLWRKDVLAWLDSFH